MLLVQYNSGEGEIGIHVTTHSLIPSLKWFPKGGCLISTHDTF